MGAAPIGAATTGAAANVGAAVGGGAAGAGARFTIGTPHDRQALSAGSARFPQAWQTPNSTASPGVRAAKRHSPPVVGLLMMVLASTCFCSILRRMMLRL